MVFVQLKKDVITIKTILSLIRHGETEWNTLGKFQGCVDIELAPEGIVQANYLAKE